MKVYTNPISTNTKRVHVLSRELGLENETVPIDFTTGEHKTPEFLARNPNGKLPVVELDGRDQWESPAIIIDLAERHRSSLFPPAGRDRTEVLRWMFWNASHLEPAIFAAVFEVVFKPQIPGAAFDPERYAKAEADFNRFAAVLDASLANRLWIAGDTFTVADIAIGTTAEVADVGKLSVDPLPNLGGWLTRLSARESWGPKALAA
ncbi:glutathione S-transferase family protein [Bauldia sp.]|uniref:glutathione S-transferase family protein n=1 Tax=Bauldia sp. TaxID=2575872 RepID=UPI003BA93B8F